MLLNDNKWSWKIIFKESIWKKKRLPIKFHWYDWLNLTWKRTTIEIPKWMGKNLGSTDYTRKAKNTDSRGNILPYGKAQQLVNQYQTENIHTSNINYILHVVYIHYILYNIYYILYNITSHLAGGRKRTGSGIGLQMLNSLLQ